MTNLMLIILVNNRSAQEDALCLPQENIAEILQQQWRLVPCRGGANVSRTLKYNRKAWDEHPKESEVNYTTWGTIKCHSFGRQCCRPRVVFVLFLLQFEAPLGLGDHGAPMAHPWGNRLRNCQEPSTVTCTWQLRHRIFPCTSPGRESFWSSRCLFRGCQSRCILNDTNDDDDDDDDDDEYIYTCLPIYLPFEFLLICKNL